MLGAIEVSKVIQEYNVLFWNFINKYDTSNTNILRKVIHSFQVAEICFSIACKKGLNENQRNFCYLMGLFHDLGRFEQWKVYNTYDDNKSVDHGDLSACIVSSMKGNDLKLNEDEYDLLIDSIKYHTKEYQGNDGNVAFYNSILNNADSYANVTTCASGAQQVVQTEEGYTEQIVEAFKNKKLMRGFSPKTKLDRCLSLTACLYYVKYDFLRIDIVNKGYVDVVYETLSKYLNNEDKMVYKQLLDDLMKEYVK